jgi:membrane-associated protein
MEFIQFIIDFVLHIDVHLAAMIADYGDWIYAILFLIIFCETGLVVTPFLPGDSLLFVAGTLAAIGGNGLNVHFLVFFLILAAVLGDSCNYCIGKFFGEKLFKNPDSKIFKQSYLEKTHQFYEKHGGSTIILARFVPIVRTFTPFIAGMGKMTYHRFILFCVLAAIIWVSIFVYLGFFFGELEFVQKHLSVLVVVIIFVSMLPGIIEILRQRTKSMNEVSEEVHDKVTDEVK